MYIDEKNKEMSDETNLRFRVYERETSERLDEIKTLIKQHRSDANQIEVAIKTDVEELIGNHNEMKNDHLTLIKGLTEQLKTLRESNTLLLQGEIYSRDIIASILELIGIINQLIAVRA